MATNSSPSHTVTQTSACTYKCRLQHAVSAGGIRLLLVPRSWHNAMSGARGFGAFLVSDIRGDRYPTSFN